MANIIGGNGTGILDSSLYLLNRNDTTGAGNAGDGEQIYVNVSSGNLVLSHLDEFLPSETNDFLTTRTYNSQGQFNSPNGEGWTSSEFSRLSVITPGRIVVTNADGSQFTFNFDPSRGVYRSVDGAGAYETISFNARSGTYSLTQSNQTVLTYDFSGRLLESKDTNGNTITYSYDLLGHLTSIADNDGHRLSFIYQFGLLTKIQDETGVVFASYQYLGNELVSMTDRAGQITRYAYNLDGTLRSITLPPTAGEAARTWIFTYSGGLGGPLLASITDAMGNTTRFNYNFSRDLFGNILGGTTTVTDAAGDTTSYTFNSNSQVTNVRDAQGNDAVYGYDANENLTSAMDANGSAIIRSDSAYYRNLRQSYGIVDASGQGKPVSQLTRADIAALQAHYTTHFTYDSNGNVSSTTDGTGNVTTYTYTSFNKIATMTSADGNALLTSNDPLCVAKRQELGFINPTTGQGKTVAQLTAADRAAIQALYTATYTYDTHQNLTQLQTPGGDLTRFAYDSLGNLTTKTVFLDSSNLTDPSTQEVTQYFYDAFGNNTKTIDAQGNTSLATYDHFGNKLTQVDGNGGITHNTYDAENRLISSTDPLGNTTVNFYDSVGNKIAVTDASGHTVTYLYNSDNLLITVIDPSADQSQAFTRTRVTQYSYDVMGNRTRATDANGNTINYTYDALNRLLTATTPLVTDASGHNVRYTTTFGYDGVGNQISVVDNNGNRTSTVYNSNNLVQSVTDASGLVTQYAYDADLNQVSIVVGAELAPAARKVLKFDYDAKDRLISQTDALGNIQHVAYNGANNRIASTDANGNTTNYTYDRDNRLLTVVQPAVTDPVTGQAVRYTTQYQYDANGNQIAVTDADGHTTRTSFDKDNRAVLVQDANGIQTVYKYDSRGNRTSIQVGVQAHLDANGNVVIDSTANGKVETYQYDEFNQVVAITDGVGNALISSDAALYVQMRQQLGIVDSNGNGKLVAQLTAADIKTLQAQFTERLVYDRDGNSTGATDHLGRTTTFTYDAMSRLVQTTDALGQKTKVAYDGDGNVVSRTDALGRKTTYAFDSMNRMIDTTDALGVDNHQTYDAFGNLASSTAAFGTADARATRFVYDLDNRLLTTTDPQGNTQTFTYDAVGNRLQVTDAKGQTTRYVYDALNRDIAIIDPLGFQTRMTYDGVGNKLSLIDANGGITRFTYDAGNREISMQDALGRVTAFTYDTLGNRVTQTTAAGTSSQETTTYLYDAENHLRQVTDAAGNVSAQNYDAVYNLTRSTDANGHATTYAYDALNRRVQITDAAGAVTHYSYDAVGNQLSVTDGNGHVTTYAYDARNQLITSTDATGVQTTYTYDSVGNQVRITHAANTAAAATTLFTYNLDNKLISQADALGNTQTYQYDANNNLVALTDALGHKTLYSYDADNRVAAITDPLGNVTQYRYDGNGNRVQITDTRGFVSTTYYNADNQVSLAVDNDGYATSYSYDANGNLASQTLYSSPLTLPLDPTVRPTPATSASDRTQLYSYDALNRLASQTDGEGYVTQYVYDAVGNRVQTRQALDRAGTQFEVTHSYYDAVNRQVASVTPQGYLSTYQYDAVGNLVKLTQYDQTVAIPSSGAAPQPVSGDAGRTTTSVYDADNRLISQTNALGVVTIYQYDARGNRVSMTQAAATASARTTTYLYDAADRNVSITNPLGITTFMVLDADGNVLTRYEAYGTSQQRVSTYQYDAKNQIVSQTDPLGVVTTTAYDAAGNVVSQTVGAGTSKVETTTCAYDGDSRQVAETDASGVLTTYQFDAAGNEIQVTEAAGLGVARTTTFVYDRANRLVTATDALGVVTQNQYDGAGNNILTINAVGTPQQRQISSVYDLDNRQLQSTDPLGRVTQYQYDAQGNQTRITDAKGNVTVNTYDASGRELTSLSAGGTLTRNTYDLVGNLVSITQSFADGTDARTTTHAYDALNRETLTTDGNGFSTSTSYDDFGNAISVTHGQYLVSSSDPAYSAAKAAVAHPETTQFTYDADNHVLTATNALGHVTSYTYDVFGNRTTMTDANGHVTTYAYDLNNRQISQTDALGNTQTIHYDAIGNKASATDALGKTTIYTYDADERITSVTDPLGNVTQYRYDALGNRVQTIDARGFISTSYYDADREVILSVDNVGYATGYSYDADGNLISQTLYAKPVTLPVDPGVLPSLTTDAADRTTQLTYDALNRVSTRTDGEGFVTRYKYDSVGDVLEIQQALDRAGTRFEVTHNYYDADSQEIATVTPQGYLATYQYDAVGNRIQQTQYDQVVSIPASGAVPQPVSGDAGRTTTFAYDATNRLIRRTDALGAVTTYQYDAKGNRISMTEAAGTSQSSTTTYQYDAADRYVSTTNALGITTSMVLDANGNVLTRYEAYGTSQQRTYTFAYDANNLVVSQTDALGVVTQTSYDADGNLVSQTLAAGTSAARTSSLTYDGDNRETAATDATGTITSYTYDAAGNQIQVTQAVGFAEQRTNTFVYDKTGRLVSATDASGTVTQYQYDGAGNKVLTVQAAGTSQQRQTSYAYDLDNRLVQVTDPAGAVTRYGYDAQGNQTRIVDANGGVQINTFDALGHSLTSLSAGGVLTRNTYDLRGNLISATQSFANGTDARTTTYAYDLLNRQTEVTDPEGFSTSIGYDDFGNQVSIVHGEYLVSSGDPSYSAAKAAQAFPQSNTFTYDANNNMLSMTDAVGNVTSYTYDAVGNRISTTDGNGHTTQYSYDLLNRLIQTTTPDGGVTRNAYDHVGNKVSQQKLQSGDPASGVWATTTYQYDANGHMTAETDPTGTVMKYTYDAMGNMLSRTWAADTPDARTEQMEYDLDNRKIADIDALGNRTTYEYDALGNRIQVTDPRGSVAHYYYNGDNQLTEVADPQGFINTFAYDSAGNRVLTTVYMTPVKGAVNPHVPPTPTPSSLDRVERAQYDGANRLISVTAPDGSVTLFSYDGAGNKVSETQFANTSAPRTLHYAYDTDNRLTSFTDVDGTITSFTYDKANNKLSQTITSTTDPNQVRTTNYSYDVNNRELSETFDPSGLDIVQSSTYDHLGNVVSRTDGDGHTTTFTYDLNNRLVSQTDPLGNTTTFAYDRIGNKTAATDARGNTTNYVYDADNRLVQEIKPQVQVYTISSGKFTNVRPTTTYLYDANGNETQTIDANGNITTKYYDGDNRLIALINADDALTTYTYDAAGDKTSQTLYMTRLSAGAHDPSVVPTPPAGNTEAITYAYDVMGRLTSTTYPPVQITTLVNTNTANPSSVTVTKQVTERYVYDAFGNMVESFDRNGNATFNYFDVKGNRIANVDSAGYLTEWAYDSQGNPIEQRIYTQPLDSSTLSPGVIPTAPSGDVYVTDIEYDAASRKIKETDPQIATFDPNTQTTSVTRPTTTYTYDKVGNQLTKTLGAGTAQAVTQYSYYDADNRNVAVIDGGRVLSTYSYDANGNVISQKRYINTVSAGVDLAQLNGSTHFASLVSADASQDEETDFTFDALNRGTSQSDILVSGTLTKRYGYDAVAGRTYTQDEDGYVTQASYDGVGRLVESISPDGSGTQYTYDAAGNQVLAYSGILTGGAPTPATNVSASLGDAVNVTYKTQGNPQHPVQTWVVYDTTSHSSIGDYASRTTTQVSSNGKGQASIASSGSGTFYFRVVTEDGYGNETWTAEQSITIPPRFSEVSVAQPNSGTIVVTAHFDAGTANPQLVYGTSGNLNQTANFVLQSDGTYQATLSGVTSPGTLSFAFKWQDSAGNSYASASSTFAAAADQVATTTTVTQSQITNNGNTAYTISVSTHVPSGYASGLTGVEAKWRVAGGTAAFSETAVSGTDSGQGFETYNAVLGDTNNLAPATYEIVLMGIRADGTSVELDHFEYIVGPSGASVTRSAVSWNAPPAGSDQLIIIGGQRAVSSTDGGRIIATDGSTDSSTDYSAYYGQEVIDTHGVTVSSTPQTQQVTDPDHPNDPPKTVTTGYNVTVAATLGTNEAANVGSDGLHLAYRVASGGTSFDHDVALTGTGAGAYSTTLSNLAAGHYDVEVYYVDAQGNKVIVEWQRIDAATASGTYTGHSLTVLAQESGGTLATNTQGVITVSAGVYTGKLDISALSSSLSLSLVETGEPAGSLQVDGRNTGYFVETQYNALNYKTASNAGDGLWRQYGVDGNGNAVKTDLLGDRSSPNYNPANAITTYTAYDGHNRKVAEFGAQVEAADGSGLVRAVDRYGYDVLDHTVLHTDALGNTTRSVFNAAGTKIEQIDPYGQTTQTLVDQFGRVTAQITQLGHRTTNFYDLQGNLIKQVDPAGDVTTYTYDAFGRKLTETSGKGNVTHYTYDQRDRVTSQTDAMGNTESFVYDGRNDLLKTLYPLGQETDQVYDSLGRVIDTEVFLNGQPTHDQRAYDAYGNLISETDAEGRTQTHVYGTFGRLLEDIDQDGNIVAYSYDVYGRKTNEYDPTTVSDPSAASDPSGGKDIQYSYNAANQVTRIVDLATHVSTSSTYDLLGHQLTEVVTTPGNVANRNISYEYDALGQLVRWGDSVTGDNLNTQFDAEGNIARVYTDNGYDPLGQNSAHNPNFRYIDHVYTYDADRRVLTEVQRTTDAAGNVSDSIINGYTYDADSNRLTWNNAGVVVTYSYDADDRVIEGDYFTGSDSNQQKWTYDAMGNVLTFTTLKNGSAVSSTVNTYNDENRTLTSNKDGQITTNTYDLTMRITRTVLQNNGKTYTYDHTYYGDGREKSVKAFGDANGNSVDTYDVNKMQVRVDLGQGDGQNRPEYKTFIVDNHGHIIYEFHDDGKSSANETDQFLYANGYGVGQNIHGTDGSFSVQLDSDGYSQIQNLGSDNPGINLTYTVQQGDTLQSIAAQMYGNPSLWFVIADANGLNAGDALKAGTVLLIPNTIQSGTLTADNHKVYSETDIVGSTLPNLKSPPPPHHGGCGSILAIIIIVVIAVVAIIATAGLATAFLGGAAAAASASTAATIAAYAAAGVIVGAIASVVQQGLFIGLGYQKSFSWKDVAASAIAGGLGGAAQGVGQAAEFAAQAGELNGIVQYAKVSEAALDVAKVASQQLIENGKITSWTSLAAAGVGGYASAAKDIATGEANFAETAEELDKATSAYQAASQIQTISNYVSPWAQLAETYVRNDRLTPSDWAGAVGATLSQAVTEGRENNTLSQQLVNGSLRLGTNTLVAGALSLVDKDGAASYLENSVGQEVGQFIGQQASDVLSRYLPTADKGSRVFDPTKNAFVNRSNGQVVQLPSEAARELKASAVSTQLAPIVTDTTIDTTSAVDGVKPPGSAVLDAKSGPVIYSVQKNDSFAKIARNLYGDERYAALIMAANGIDPSYSAIHGLQIGTDLKLPVLSDLNLSDASLAKVLRAGGNLIAADQATTDQIKAQQAQALQLQQQQQQEQMLQQQAMAPNGPWWTLSPQAQSSILAANPGWTPSVYQAPATAPTMPQSTDSGGGSWYSNLYHSATSYLSSQATAFQAGGLGATDLGTLGNLAESYVSDQVSAFQEGGFAATDLGKLQLAADNTVTRWGNAIDSGVQKGEQWLDNFRAQLPQAEANLANRFSDVLGLDQDSSVRGALAWVAKANGQYQSNLLGVTEGGLGAVYDLGKGVVNLAYGADQLLNPLEWAANPDANLSRIKTTVNSVETLGKIASLANTTSWITNYNENAQLAGTLWNGISTSFQKDPSKFIGNAGVTAASFFVGAGEVGVAGDVLKAEQVVQDASKAVNAVHDVTVAAGAGEDLVLVYRGTPRVLETQTFEETGHLLSDAAQITYQETGSLKEAYSVADATHQQWIDIWGSEEQYAQAHAEFGTLLKPEFGLDRTFVSVTTDKAIAARYAGSGRIYSGYVPKSLLVPQTLPGATESELLLRGGTDLLKPIVH